MQHALKQKMSRISFNFVIKHVFTVEFSISFVGISFININFLCMCFSDIHYFNVHM